MYAAICNFHETTAILVAWHDDESSAFDASTAAMERSGIQPPDLQAFEWGGIMGTVEAAARHEVARSLELAVAAGDIVPGTRGWKQRTLAVASAALARPLPGHPQNTWLEAINRERAEDWLEGRRRDKWRQHLLAGTGIDVMRSVQPPAGVTAVQPVLALLEAARGGIELTASGYLPRALVVELTQRFGWQDPVSKPPRSEVDSIPVMDLRHLVTRMRAVRRRKRTLSLTTTGRALVDDPGALWRSVVKFWPDGDFQAAALEVGALLILSRGGLSGWSNIAADAALRLSDEGWTTGPQHSPISATDARGALARPIHLATNLGWLEQSWRDATITLHSSGRASLREFLHQRALAPMSR